MRFQKINATLILSLVTSTTAFGGPSQIIKLGEKQGLSTRDINIATSMEKRIIPRASQEAGTSQSWVRHLDDTNIGGEDYKTLAGVAGVKTEDSSVIVGVVEYGKAGRGDTASALTYELNFQAPRIRSGDEKETVVHQDVEPVLGKFHGSQHQGPNVRSFLTHRVLRTSSGQEYGVHVTRTVDIRKPNEESFINSDLMGKNISGSVSVLRKDGSQRTLHVLLDNKTGYKWDLDFDFKEAKIAEYLRQNPDSKLNISYVTLDQRLVVEMKDKNGQVTTFTYAPDKTDSHSYGSRFVSMTSKQASKESGFTVTEIPGRQSAKSVKGFSSTAPATGSF